MVANPGFDRFEPRTGFWPLPGLGECDNMTHAVGRGALTIWPL